MATNFHRLRKYKRLQRGIVKMQKLANLREKTRGTAFDAARGCFVRQGKTVCSGLLPALDRAFPVPKHTESECKRCGGKVRGASQASLSARASLRASKKRKKRGDFIAIGPADATDDLPVSPYTPPQPCMGFTAMRHGQAIDSDIEMAVSVPNYVPADPCAAKLLHHICHTRKWIPVAAQLPMYSPSLGLATAIDLLCVDEATRRRLILVEVKSTWSRLGSPAQMDACYRTVAQGGRGTDVLPQSRYMQHQLQLWAMWYMLRADFGIEADESLVIRVGPTFLAEYPLNRRVCEREADILTRLR